MTKVYVTQESTFDFRTAREFGELVFLTSKHQDVANVTETRTNQDLLEQIRAGLRDYTDEDWVILTGSPYVNALVMFTIGEKSGRYEDATKVKLLRWDNRGFCYLPLPISLY